MIYKEFRMVKNIFAFILLAVICFQPLFAIKAKRGIYREMEMADGRTVSVELAGDEHIRYYISSEGNVLIPNKLGQLEKISSANFEKLISERLEQRGIMKKKATREVASYEPWRGLGLYDEEFPHWGSPKALIVLVAYADVPFTVKNPKDYFTRFLNEEGFSDDGATGSVRDYFIHSSMGQFNPQFDVYGPVMIDKRATYGANDIYGDDKNAGGMVVDACKALDKEINFAEYDTDGDGFVDNVYIIYAGPGEASGGPSSSIWPHQWTLQSANGEVLELDGVKIDNYGCCNELESGKPDGIGTFCHEFSHVLGLPDLYTYSRTKADLIATPADWSILDYGPYNNGGHTPPSYSAFERNAMGWIDLKVIDKNEDITLAELQESNDAYILPTEKENEFFLFENRQKTSWDKYLPGHGMLVWHINYNWMIWMYNEVNETADKQYVDIEEANNNPNNYSSSAMAGYPFPGTSKNTEISDITTPNLLSWGKKKSGFTISNITETDGIIRFSVRGSAGIEDAMVHESFESEIFTLQGIKVSGDIPPGVYLERKGNKIIKKFIK